MDTALTVRTMRRHSWALMIRKQADSGLSINEWCRQNDISPKTFYYRRKQVQSMILDNAQEARFAEITPPAPSSSCSSGFSGASAMAFSPQLILSARGVLIGINEDTPKQLLANTLEILHHA